MTKKLLLFTAGLVLVLLSAWFLAFNAGPINASPDGSYGYQCSSCHPGKADQTPPNIKSSAPAPTPSPKTPPTVSSKTKPATESSTEKKNSQTGNPVENTLKVLVEGRYYVGTKIGGKVYMSVRDYADAAGYSVAWDNLNSAVILSDLNNHFVFHPVEGKMTSDGKTFNVSGMLKNGVSYLDVAAFTQSSQGSIFEENGIIKVRISGDLYQWRISGHNFDLLSSEKENLLVNDNCNKCHNGAVFATVNLTGQTKPYTEVNQKEVLGCKACHDDSSADPALLKGQRPFVTPQGLTIDAGNGTICLNCHNGQQDTTVFSALYNTYRAPLPGPQAEVLFGYGGFGFGDFRLQQSPHGAISDTCVSCHMAEGESEWSDVGGHTFRIANGTKQNLNACTPCHADFKTIERRAFGDYDGDKVLESIQDEVLGLQALLKQAIIRATDSLGVVDVVDIQGSIGFITDSAPQKTLDPKKKEVPANVYRAAWNLFLTEKDGSRGVHNPAYVVQLLQQSYKAVAGQDVPNASIR